MTRRHPLFLNLRLTTVATAALLAACGGGGGEPADAAPTAPQAPSAAEPEATGRAQALAYTLPPLSAPPAGLSGNVRCANLRLGAITVDNVQVPSGTACRLNGTVVRGSVQVAPGGIVIAAGGVDVAGSVQGDQAAHVQVAGHTSRVGGNIQLEGGGSATLTDVRVGGDIFINGLNDIIVTRNTTVGGNIQVTDNSGGAEITGNRANGNLQCTGNVPAPLASHNAAASIEDQCRPGSGAGSGGGSGSGSGGSAPPALSGNVTCVGLSIGAVRLDSVIVPAGARCTLVGTQLIGSIEVGAGARLIADSVNVHGNVIADGAAELSVFGSSAVGGSVQVQRGAAASLAGVAITGNLQIDAMSGPVTASANRVNGNLQAFGNRGGLNFAGNRMGGVMQCKENLPAPRGSGNVATLKEDQCTGL